MNEGLQAILNDDGVFEEYDDTYDLIIHCGSKEEQEEVLNKLNRRWIPVSERLPETNDDVLVTYIVNGNIKKRYVETASWFSLGDEWVSPYDEYRMAKTKIDIIAWMPLPQPYKVESEG